MLPIQLLLSQPSLPLQSPSITSSRYHSHPQLSSFVDFKHQIQFNYTHSVPNLIYSFPFSMEYSISLIDSEDDDEEEENSFDELLFDERYDLNLQNRNRRGLSLLDNEDKMKRGENQRRRREIEGNGQKKKREVRERGEKQRRKYGELLGLGLSKSKGKGRLGGKSKGISKKKSEKKNVKRNHAIEQFYCIPTHAENQKQKNEQKQLQRREKPRGKSNRLKTQPDESFKSTFRRAPVSGILKNAEI